MKVNTFTVVVGNAACNACCPFCVSKMTPSCGVDLKKELINTRNFLIAAKFARSVGATTALLTGKGEPTLFPDDITYFIHTLRHCDFYLIELQTNGLLFWEHGTIRDIASVWFRAGMTTVSLSVVHWSNQINNEVMFNDEESRYDFWQVIDFLHSVGFSVRLNCTILEHCIDNFEDVETFVETCRKNKVEQITFRSVARPTSTKNKEVSDWVDMHLWEDCESMIIGALKSWGAKELLHLPHGAIVFDLNGQNVCVNNCLTSTTNPEEIRQLIYFPDGKLRYDWKYEGAIIF